MNGKGSRSRVKDHEAYRKNWDNIFGNPGSDKAAEAGCLCPRLDNGNGNGSSWGPNTFWINGDCPIHGQSVIPWEKLKEACGIKPGEPVHGKKPKLRGKQSKRTRGFHKLRRD